MGNVQETVTITLEKYEELIDIKRKYENDTRSKLANEIELIRARCEQIEFDNHYMAHYIKNKAAEFAIKVLTDFSHKVFSNINWLGFIKKSKLEKIINKCYSNITIDKIDLFDEWPSKEKYDIPLYKNETTTVANSDFVALHRDMDNVVYEFIKKHEIPNGYVLNYNIDSLQDLKNSGVPCGACDGYLGISDFNNNEIIASM